MAKLWGLLDEKDVKSAVIVIGILLVIAFIVGCVIGFGVGKSGEKREFDRGRAGGLAEGEKIGFEKGKIFGGENGYLRGYEDKTYGNPNAVETNEKAKLGERRNEAKGTALYITVLLAIPFFLFWLPFIYIKNPETGKASFDDFEKNKSFRYALGAKVFLTILSVVVACIFLPHDFLAQICARYFNSIPIETLNQIVLILTGAIFCILIVLLIEFSTSRSENQTMRFWSQIAWAIIFPVILYQIIGSLVTTHSVNSDSVVKMLLLQAGISICLIVLFCQRCYRIYRKHKPQML